MIGESTILDFTASPKDFVQVEVFAGTKLDELAKMIEMEPSKLFSLNKQFTTGTVPKKKAVYTITIPEEKMILFYLRYEFPQEQKTIKPHLISHYVCLGETLESIAKQYHTTTEEIRAANHLNDDFLMLDTLLVIPVSRELFEKVLKE